MSQVVIHCPSTDKDIPTGIDLDKTAWEMMKIDQGATQCLWCGELHVWSKQEARLEDLSAQLELPVHRVEEPVEEADEPTQVIVQPVLAEKIAAQN
ncbi:hypothetical protein [Microlunatus speluncae]|uniref:hypothetical protein n=1 Tax=Microlunatus speluncae TaxID=2594267 RepID=UPI00126642BA|nr:hypothetical protein [Microlunatus speluncae]